MSIQIICNHISKLAFCNFQITSSSDLKTSSIDTLKSIILPEIVSKIHEIDKNVFQILPIFVK